MNNKMNCEYSGGYPEKRWIQFLILRVLYEKPSYGYEVIKSIEDLTEGRHQIKSGTVYTLLRRMEENGLLVSKWKKGDGKPDKRVYKVSKKGEKLLKSWLEAVMGRKRMIDKMARFYRENFGGKNKWK